MRKFSFIVLILFCSISGVNSQVKKIHKKDLSKLNIDTIQIKKLSGLNWIIEEGSCIILNSILKKGVKLKFKNHELRSLTDWGTIVQNRTVYIDSPQHGHNEYEYNVINNKLSFINLSYIKNDLSMRNYPKEIIESFELKWIDDFYIELKINKHILKLKKGKTL